jgi:hypothetical protein
MECYINKSILFLALHEKPMMDSERFVKVNFAENWF